ncbi:MAG: CDP-diacylglycerol--glycerol-3-phosphate 3-phosphatidyltransferase [Acidimicrobiia bacterium]
MGMRTIRACPRWRRAITIPDLLAVARVILVPVVMVLVRSADRLEHAYGYAATLFVVAALTDFFDGYLARRWNLTTTLGAFLDTTADKLLVTGTLFALVSVDRVSIWAAVIIVMREFIVMALRGLVAISGSVMAPSMWGKVKATVQFTAIGLAFLRLPEPWGPLYLDQWAMWLAVGVTIASGWQYLAVFMDTVRASRATTAQ